MKKNGFTLIEAIGIIIVIALVATVTIPIIINSNDRNRIVEQEKKDIKEAIMFYLEAHPELKESLRSEGEIEVEVKNLINEGYIAKAENFTVITVRQLDNGSYDIEF